VNLLTLSTQPETFLRKSSLLLRELQMVENFREGVVLHYCLTWKEALCKESGMSMAEERDGNRTVVVMMWLRGLKKHYVSLGLRRLIATSHLIYKFES
jgi:hypothetical protein